MPRLNTSPPTIQNVRCAEPVDADSPDAMAHAVRDARGAGLAVVDYGRFHEGLGHAPPQEGVTVRPPTAILEHAAGDMVLRAGGGATLGAIADALARAGQWLALDGAPADMSLADAIAHNVSGPLLVGFRNTAAQLLGLTAVTGPGRVIRVGGRTVKNVAGYDMTRLLVGNLNGLALVAEAACRTRALPERFTRLVVEPAEPLATADGLTTLLCGDGAPDALAWRADGDRPGALTMTWLGRPRAVVARRDAARQWIELTFAHADPDVTDDQGPGLEAVRPPTEPDWRWAAPAAAKLIVPPRHAGSLIQAARDAAREATAHRPASDARPGRDAAAPCRALPTEGVAWVGGDWSLDEARRFDEAIRPRLARMQGLRVWLRRPNHAPSLTPVDPEPDDWPLVRRLKRQLDPDAVLNPGRIPPYAPPQGGAT